MESILLGLLVIVGVIVAIAVFFAIVIGLSIYRGWALSYLWQWFMVPIGLPALSVPQCIGVALVITFLTHQYYREPEDKRTDNEKITAGVITVLGPLVTLGFGWCVKQYLM